MILLYVSAYLIVIRIGLIVEFLLLKKITLYEN
jgi:hypothetical protein